MLVNISVPGKQRINKNLLLLEHFLSKPLTGAIFLTKIMTFVLPKNNKFTKFSTLVNVLFYSIINIIHSVKSVKTHPALGNNCFISS